MFVVRNKKTKALMKPGSKKVFIVYLDKSEASRAISAYGGINKFTKREEFEIVPVKMIEKKE